VLGILGKTGNILFILADPLDYADLQQFAIQCRTSPQCLNQWPASTAVTAVRAWLSALSRAARVRAFAGRQPVLTFDQHGSIGDSSGA
jgi:hypothetical protein